MPDEEQQPRFDRRLSDLVVASFFRACTAQDFVTADHLLHAVESLLKRQAETIQIERRAAIDLLASLRTHLLLASMDRIEDARGESTEPLDEKMRAASLPAASAGDRPVVTAGDRPVVTAD